MERRWWTLGLISTATFMLLLDITVVNVALPDIQRDLGASLPSLQWVVDAYALTLAAFLLTAGSLGDRLGRRRVFTLGFAIFTLASFLCGIAGDATLLNLARGLQGVGGAAMFATSLALIGQEFHGRDRATAFGVWGATVGGAVAIGPLVGGLITEHLGWEWIFFVNVPIGLAAILLTQRRIVNVAARDPEPVDLPGLVSFSAALFLLIFGLIRGNPEGWGSPLIVACLAGAALLLAAFVAIERRSPHPMLDLALFRKRAFNGVSAVAFGLSAGMFAMFLYLTIYLQGVLDYSPLEAGLRFLPLTLLSFLAAPISGSLSHRIPIRALLGTGLALVGVGLLLMRGIAVDSGWTALLAGFIFAGVGIGIANPDIGQAAIAVVPVERSGMGSGINTTFRQVGIATGVAALGAVFQSRVDSRLGDLLPDAPGGLGEAVASGGSRGATALVPAIRTGARRRGRQRRLRRRPQRHPPDRRRDRLRRSRPRLPPRPLPRLRPAHPSHRRARAQVSLQGGLASGERATGPGCGPSRRLHLTPGGRGWGEASCAFLPELNLGRPGRPLKKLSETPSLTSPQRAAIRRRSVRPRCYTDPMLRELRIENLLLIERAELRLGEGLNAITGETGAGKTVLAHSLDLLMGGKARSGIVRPEAPEAWVEGVFDLPPGLLDEPELAELAERLPEGAEEVVLGRRVSASGRTSAFVAGRAASAADLRLLGGRLLAFYGQHEHRKLTIASAQLEILDGFAGPEHLQLRDRYREAHGECVRLAAEVAELREREGSRERDLDLYRYELSEIEEVGPDPQEREALAAERERLRHAEGLREAAAGAHAGLAGTEEDGAGGAAAALAQAEALLRGAAGLDAGLDAIAARLAALAVEVADAGSELRDYAEGVEADPAALGAVEERLEAIDRLERKHGGSVEAVLAHAERCREEIARLEGAAERGAEAEAALAAAEERRRALGEELSAGRAAAAEPLRRRVAEELARLAMEGASLEVALEPHPDGYGPSGRETVELRMAPNPGIEAAPLREAASGGELSRVMLALSGLGAAASAPTMVFDEIDAGIGGSTARAVGERLRALGRERQVLCITHLPQVASLADVHFRLRKEVAGDRALATVRRLEGEEVVEEIRRMLGGERSDEAATRHARELLAAA